MQFNQSQKSTQRTMNYFANLPMDVVKCILAYDRRFVIRNGEIVTIDKLNRSKYTNIFDLLLSKATIEISFVNREWTLPWEFISNVQLTKNIQISYTCVGSDKDTVFLFNNKDRCSKVNDGVIWLK